MRGTELSKSRQSSHAELESSSSSSLTLRSRSVTSCSACCGVRGAEKISQSLSKMTCHASLGGAVRTASSLGSRLGCHCVSFSKFNE